jgi:ribosome maturation factor RimP
VGRSFFFKEVTVDVIEKLKSLLTPPLLAAGYELSSLTLVHEKEGLTLHILVDRDAPISLDDIVKVSDLINPLLDQADPIAEPYTLDVASLGAEKPLKIDRLEHYLHRYMALHLVKPYEGENLLEGELLETSPTSLTLRVRQKSRYNDVVLVRADVDKANLAIKF